MRVNVNFMTKLNISTKSKSNLNVFYKTKFLVMANILT